MIVTRRRVTMIIDAGIPKLPRWTKLPNEANDYSDWRIQLKSPNTESNKVEEIAVYSVHRACLSWYSDYFKNLLVGDRFSESLQNQSTIELPSIITSEHFEQLLDFFYTGKLELNSFNAIAVAYFGDYFGISSLKTEVISFLSELECSDAEMIAYYMVAGSLHMENIEKTLAKKWAFTPSILSNESELSKIDNVVRFCRLICSERMDIQKSSAIEQYEEECWSVGLAAFIDTYSNHMDKDDFSFLTQIDSLPVVSHAVATKLMHQEQRFGLNEHEYNGGNEGSCHGDKDCCNHFEEMCCEANRICHYNLTSLQRRCIDAFIERLTDPDKNLHTKMRERDTLKELPPAILTSLILRMTAKLHKRR